MTQSYARYMPGEACPGNYAPATTTTCTTSTVTVSPTYEFTYFRATDVVCCPLCVPSPPPPVKLRGAGGTDMTGQGIFIRRIRGVQIRHT
jgi:hypothetical protein